MRTPLYWDLWIDIFEFSPTVDLLNLSGTVKSIALSKKTIVLNPPFTKICTTFDSQFSKLQFINIFGEAMTTRTAIARIHVSFRLWFRVCFSYSNRFFTFCLSFWNETILCFDAPISKLAVLSDMNHNEWTISEREKGETKDYVRITIRCSSHELSWRKKPTRHFFSIYSRFFSYLIGIETAFMKLLKQPE